MTRLIVLAIAALGCGSGSSQATTPTTDEASSVERTCVAFFERQRECSDSYVPELVALRVRFDRPEGIAERDRREGRDALIADAHAEYRVSSVDSSIRERCAHIAREPDAEQVARNFAACVEHDDCGGFVPCDLALLVQHWAAE